MDQIWWWSRQHGSSWLSTSWGFIHCHHILAQSSGRLVCSKWTATGLLPVLKIQTSGLPALSTIELKRSNSSNYILVSQNRGSPSYLSSVLFSDVPRSVNQPAIGYLPWLWKAPGPGRRDVQHFIQRVRGRMGLAQGPGNSAEWTAQSWRRSGFRDGRDGLG